MSLSTLVAIEKHFDSVLQYPKGTPLFYECTGVYPCALGTPESMIVKSFSKRRTLVVPTSYLITSGGNKDKAEKAFFELFTSLLNEIEELLPRESILTKRLYVEDSGRYLQDPAEKDLVFYGENLGFVYEVENNETLNFNQPIRLNKTVIVEV